MMTDLIWPSLIQWWTWGLWLSVEDGYLEYLLLGVVTPFCFLIPHGLLCHASWPHLRPLKPWAKTYFPVWNCFLQCLSQRWEASSNTLFHPQVCDELTEKSLEESTRVGEADSSEISNEHQRVLCRFIFRLQSPQNGSFFFLKIYTLGLKSYSAIIPTQRILSPHTSCS